MFVEGYRRVKGDPRFVLGRIRNLLRLQSKGLHVFDHREKTPFSFMQHDLYQVNKMKLKNTVHVGQKLLLLQLELTRRCSYISTQLIVHPSAYCCECFHQQRALQTVGSIISQKEQHFLQNAKIDKVQKTFTVALLFFLQSKNAFSIQFWKLQFTEEIYHWTQI